MRNKKEATVKFKDLKTKFVNAVKLLPHDEYLTILIDLICHKYDVCLNEEDNSLVMHRCEGDAIYNSTAKSS